MVENNLSIKVVGHGLLLAINSSALVVGDSLIVLVGNAPIYKKSSYLMQCFCSK